MYAVGVIAEDGTVLMPCYNPKKVRRLLKQKKAHIYSYEPFAIQLDYEIQNPVSDEEVELSIDSGQYHIGISVKSSKHEFVSEQRDNLPDEKERHDSQRKLRRSRRNRLRYRSMKVQTKPEGWFAPSLVHIMENHLHIIEMYMKVFPVSRIVIETGSFDTMVLKAYEKGEPMPEGVDYQHGEKYGFDTQREAVFYRDKYKCIICGRSPMENKETILRMHHLGFWKNDRSSRIDNLATVCTKCHTQKNHKKGGALYGLEPRTADLSGAAYMNTVRWEIMNRMKELDCVKNRDVEVKRTYGAVTKRERLTRNMEKSHANDAYCIGELHPKHRAGFRHYKKVRRNNRILEKFYDAKYIDTRIEKDTKDNPAVKTGSQLSCGRTNRSEARNSDKNLRIYRGQKVSKGHRSIRKKRYALRPGDVVIYNDRKRTVIGVHNNGDRVKLEDVMTVNKADVKPVIRKDKKAQEEKPLPLIKGNKCVITTKNGKEVRKEILDVKGDMLILKAEKSVKISDVKCLMHTGGWVRIS